jgi:hypothetical protein
VPIMKIASRRRLLEKVRYPGLTYSQYAYDRRRQFVAGDPGIFKPQRRYVFIMTAGTRFFNWQVWRPPHGGRQPALTASLNALPAVNLTVLAATI